MVYCQRSKYVYNCKCCWCEEEKCINAPQGMKLYLILSSGSCVKKVVQHESFPVFLYGFFVTLV